MPCLRSPRHDALGKSACVITIRMDAYDPHHEYCVTLTNLSRNGIQLCLAEPLPCDEHAVIRIRHVQGDLDVELAGVVRWRRTSGDDGWSIGCEFNEPLSYEVLGELFLRGILEMKR